MAGRFSVEAVFKAVDRVTAPVTRMQNRIGKMTRSMNRGFQRVGRTVKTFEKGIKRAALATAAALAISSGAMADVISTGAEFEQTLVSAAAKFPNEIRKGTEAFKELEDAARRTGSTTEFTASQSAQALNFLAMAGFNAKSSIAALPGIVDLATVAQIDLAQASDIATDSLGAFNLLSDDAAKNQKNLARISDVFTKATTSANLSVEQMFEAIKNGAPVGVAAGQSLETVATFAAIMANAGIKGTRASTGLKNIFLALSAPASGAAKVMRKLGIQTAGADGKIRDAVDVFQDFSKATKKLPQQSQLQIFNEIFGKIPIAAAINLTNAADKMEGFRSELIKSTSITKTMADVMRDTLEGRLKSLTSAVEGVKISIFKLTSGPLSDAIDKTTEWVRANEKLIATNVGKFLADIINNFEEIVKIGRQVAGVTVAYIALTAALKIASAATLIFNAVNALLSLTIGLVKGFIVAYVFIVGGIPKVLAAARIAVLAFNLALAANPVGLIVGGIALFVAALVGMAALIFVAWDPVKDFFIDLWERIKNITSGIGSFARKFGTIFGFVDSDTDAEKSGEDTEQSPFFNVISPQERIKRIFDEVISTNRSEVTIRDDTGRAEVTQGPLGRGLTLESAGAF